MVMRFISLLVVGMLLMTAVSTAQFKSQTEQQSSVAQSLIHPARSLSSFLGLLNPDNFLMRHNFSLSYWSWGGKGISLASYTNSMFYRIADPLNVQFDLTLQGSPFGQYGVSQQNDFSRMFLSRAELNYQPSTNFLIQLQYRQLPFYYPGGYAPYPYSTILRDE